MLKKPVRTPLFNLLLNMLQDGHKCTIGMFGSSNAVQEGYRRFKKAREGSRRLTNTQETIFKKNPNKYYTETFC